jgi:uncharacterized integral membrane protein
MSILRTATRSAKVPVDTSPAPSNQSPAEPAEPAEPPPVMTETRPKVRGTRTGRVWVAACAAALITVALIIFMVQNTHTVSVSFLGLTGSTSLALMLLIAAVGGILLTLILGSARIIQLRHAVRRPRR